MKWRKFITAWVVLLPLFCAAQTTPNSIGASQFSGENGLAANDSFSVINNPASMRSDSTLVGIAAHNYFLTDGLFQFSAASQFTTPLANVGIGISHFGDELLNETTATVGVSKALAEDLQLGISLQYFSMFAQQAERGQTLYPSIGLLYNLSDQFIVGVVSQNPFSQDVQAPFHQQLSAHTQVGFAYLPSQDVETNLQLGLRDGENLTASFGIKFSPLDAIAIQLGANTSPGFFTGGLAIKVDRFRIGMGGKQQTPLGFSPTFVTETSF